MSKKTSGIIIAVLAVAALGEGIYIASGKAHIVPKLENGQEAIVELNDGTKYSANDIWNELKGSYGLTNIINKVDAKILGEEYKDNADEVKQYLTNAELSIKAQYKDDKGNVDESKMLSTLQQYGYNDLDSYLETVKASYLQNKAATDYAKTIVTDSEIKDYYKSDVKPDLTGVHILVKPSGTDDDSLAAAKTKAESIIADITKRANKGEKLEDIFKSYDSDSDDATSYQDLGTFNYTDMVEDFSKAAYNLKAGEMSKTPVKTSYGYHVILITKIGEKKSLDDSKDSIKTLLAEKKVSADSTISVTAMDKLREKYGMKIVDSEINEKYKKYINYQLNNKNK